MVLSLYDKKESKVENGKQFGLWNKKEQYLRCGNDLTRNESSNLIGNL